MSGIVRAAGAGGRVQASRGVIAGRMCRSWAVVLTLLLLVACSEDRRSRALRPNLVLISLDTLRADRLGSYGYRSRPTSPNLDDLAEEGVRFEVHVAASPWTTPSHLSLFTSLTPASHGVVMPFSELATAMTEGEPVPTLSTEHATLATVLREAGYRTAAFTGGGTLAPELGFGRGFDRYETDMVKIGPGSLARMLDWISEPDGRPFFLFWHTFEVHAPYLDPRFLESEILSDSISLREELEGIRQGLLESASSELDGTRNAVMELVRVLQRRGLWRQEVIEALYDGSIASADEGVGRVLEHLRRRGLESETLVVVTSDHGEEFADHSDLYYDAHGRTLYEEMIRVPLLIRFPGRVPAGARIRRQSRSIDLLPTVLELLGVPWDPKSVEGRSLVARIRRSDSDAAPPESAVSEALADAWEAKSVRTDEYKYVEWFAPEQLAEHGRRSPSARPARRELFHLPSDPFEHRNLLNEPDSLSAAERAAVRALESYLAARPNQVLAPEARALTEEELRRLRALGYLGRQ